MQSKNILLSGAMALMAEFMPRFNMPNLSAGNASTTRGFNTLSQKARRKRQRQKMASKHYRRVMGKRK